LPEFRRALQKCQKQGKTVKAWEMSYFAHQ